MGPQARDRFSAILNRRRFSVALGIKQKLLAMARRTPHRREAGPIRPKPQQSNAQADSTRGELASFPDANYPCVEIVNTRLYFIRLGKRRTVGESLIMP